MARDLSAIPTGAPTQSTTPWWLIDIGACQSGGLLLWSGVSHTHTPSWRRMRCVRFLWSGLAKNRGSGSRSASKLIVGQMWASGALKCFSGVQERDKKEGGTCGTEQVSLQRRQVYVNATVSDIFVKRRESSADQLGPTNRDKLWLRVVVTELTYVSGFISADTLKPLSFSPSIKEFTGPDNKSFFLVPEVRPESSPDALLLLHASFLRHTRTS